MMSTPTPAKQTPVSAAQSARHAPPLILPVPVLALIGLLIVVIPALQGGHLLSLATEALCWAIAAAALDIMVGYAGLAPLGHIAMWGLGTYSAALMIKAGWPLPVVLPAAMLLGAAYSALTAPLALRAGGIFFLMVTLAFAQMLQVVADKWTAVTGGTDGLNFKVDMNPMTLYLIVLGCGLLTMFILTRLVKSPFGRVLEAIRQNEGRARALGYPVFAYKYGAVLIASAFIALGGALMGYHTGIATPSDLFWLKSAVLLIMVLLGGARSLWGPVIGALLYINLQDVISSRTDMWAGIVGLLLIALVYTGRGGLWSLIERRRR